MGSKGKESTNREKSTSSKKSTSRKSKNRERQMSAANAIIRMTNQNDSDFEEEEEDHYSEDENTSSSSESETDDQKEMELELDEADQRSSKQSKTNSISKKRGKRKSSNKEKTESRRSKRSRTQLLAIDNPRLTNSDNEVSKATAAPVDNRVFNIQGHRTGFATGTRDLGSGFNGRLGIVKTGSENGTGSQAVAIVSENQSRNSTSATSVDFLSLTTAQMAVIHKKRPLSAEDNILYNEVYMGLWFEFGLFVNPFPSLDELQEKMVELWTLGYEKRPNLIQAQCTDPRHLLGEASTNITTKNNRSVRKCDFFKRLCGIWPTLTFAEHEAATKSKKKEVKRFIERVVGKRPEQPFYVSESGYAYDNAWLPNLIHQNFLRRSMFWYKKGHEFIEKINEVFIALVYAMIELSLRECATGQRAPTATRKDCALNVYFGWHYGAFCKVYESREKRDLYFEWLRAELVNRNQYQTILDDLPDTVHFNPEDSSKQDDFLRNRLSILQKARSKQLKLQRPHTMIPLTASKQRDCTSSGEDLEEEESSGSSESENGSDNDPISGNPLETTLEDETDSSNGVDEASKVARAPDNRVSANDIDPEDQWSRLTPQGENDTAAICSDGALAHSTGFEEEFDTGKLPPSEGVALAKISANENNETAELSNNAAEKITRIVHNEPRKVIQPQLRQSSRRIAARKAETPDFTQGDKEAFEIAAAERDRETELLFAKQREEHARKKT